MSGSIRLSERREDSSLRYRRVNFGQRVRKEGITFVEWPRVYHDNAEHLPLPFRLEKNPLDDRTPCIRENRLSVFDFGDGVLLDHAVGENDTVTNERVDLVDEERLGLREQ